MKQELQAVAELQEAKETFIGRIFSVVGSGIFLLDTLLSCFVYTKYIK
ncbi:hypothetical protein [Bacillus cereus group sp. BfR-BA-01380]|nr:hypothetical protein [Bacillus cereus group sp. BfR-BA-01380]